MSKNEGLTLTEFLEARIAEDEAVARSVMDSDIGSTIWCAENDGAVTEAEATDEAAYVNQYSPSRALDECFAKREILALHGSVEDRGWLSGEANDYLWCSSCGWLDDAPVAFPCRTFKTIATIYKDHSDYKDEWRV